MIKNCYIRVDANNLIGIGHLVRTEILADKLAEKGIRIIFLCHTIPETYKKKLVKKKYIIKYIEQIDKELLQITDILNNSQNNLLITDSDKDEFYTKDFQLGIKNIGTKLMIITFFHRYRFYADIILNQNIMALSQQYSCEDYTVKLLGLKNVILNDVYREISKNLNKFKTNLPNKTVLITFGGVDKPNRTKVIYQLLQNIKQKPDKIIIVLGLMYKYKKELEEIIKQSKIETEMYQNTPKMPYLLAESDVVFNSGGLSVWEAGVFKSLNIIIGYSDREKTGGKFLHEEELAIYLGNEKSLSSNRAVEKIEKILETDPSDIIKNLYTKIDVNGIYNVVKEILKL